MTLVFSRLFPFWLLCCVGLALWHPPLFTWFSGRLIPFGLGCIMLGMGLTLTFADFRRVLRLPWVVLAGFAIQYTVMPLTGFFLAAVLGLPVALAAGLILVASCPGGTASNVIAFLARADVPLSVTLTAFSTLAAAVITPLWTYVLAGSRIEVSVMEMSLSTGSVVVGPVLVGLFLNAYARPVSRILQPVAAPLAIVFICLIVASITGQNRAHLFSAGPTTFLAAFLLHASGFAFGYAIMWFLFRKYEHVDSLARTVSIETGMQNSGLAVFLALKHFADPLSALPGALSSVVHSLVGSLLAWIWSRQGCTRRS